MSRFLKNTFTMMVIAAAFAASVQASNPASDNAGNYTAGFWATGTNWGSGFAAWTLTSSGGGGSYIGGTGQNNAGPSFGLFGNASGVSSADRPFTGGPLTAGQTFSIDLGNSLHINTGGDVGLNLTAAGTPEFTLKFTGGQSTWALNDGGTDFNISQGFAANTDLLFTFTYNGGSSYSYTFGSAAGNNFTASGTISGIDGVRLFSNNQGAGDNLGFNNLAIIPEPSTVALVGIGLLGACFVRRRKA